MNELVVMRLFAEVKVWSYGVLKEMDDQVADKYEKRRSPVHASSMLSGTISTRAVANINPAPSATK